MGIGIWFWLTMALAIIGAVWGIYPNAGPPWRSGVGGFLLVVAFVLLVIAVFGGPIKG